MSVPATCCCLGPLGPFPRPWHRRPSSFEYEASQMSLNLGFRRSCRYSNVVPESGSNTPHAISAGGVHHNASKYAGNLRCAARAGSICNDCINKACSLGVALTRDFVRRVIGSVSVVILDPVRLVIGSCGRGGVLMATLGDGCGVMIVASPHVTFCTLGAGCESWCEGAIACTGVSDRGEASKCLPCASRRRERRTFAGDIVLGTDVAGPTGSCTGLLACYCEQASRKSLIAFNCASQQSVGTSANAPVSKCRPCSIRSAGVTLGRVRWLWRYSTVSEIVTDNVLQGITLLHR